MDYEKRKRSVTPPTRLVPTTLAASWGTNHSRGINSIQLMNDGKRWWIVTIFWQGEDEKNPLPEKYLKQD